MFECLDLKTHRTRSFCLDVAKATDESWFGNLSTTPPLSCTRHSAAHLSRWTLLSWTSNGYLLPPVSGIRLACAAMVSPNFLQKIAKAPQLIIVPDCGNYRKGIFLVFYTNNECSCQYFLL